MTNTEKAYKMIMEDIIDSSKKFIVVQGIGDVSKQDGVYKFITQTHWHILGHLDVDQELMCAELDVDLDKEGEYFFSAIFQICDDEMFLEHISLDFQQTFQQRDREEKLLSLGIDFDFI